MMSGNSDRPEEGLETLKRLISWFHDSSLDLTQEYRRLEERVANLNRELERKNQELEESLREREEAKAYLLSVLESLKAGVLVLDKDLCPTLANRRLAELSGHVDQERVVQLVGKELILCLKRDENEFLPFECERVVCGPGGVMTPVNLTISQVVVAGKQRSGYVLVFNDISRLKRLEVEAARSCRLAALGVMAAEVAHQIRSPLGGIELYASLLKEREEGETKRLADEILSAVQRLYTAISHLLSFVAEPSIDADVLPVSLLLREVKDLSLPLLREGKWALEIRLEPGLPSIWGDRGLLAQALFNLVANATEAMPNGGWVKIKAQLSPFYSMNGHIYRAVEIQVTDEGVGIPPENRERIFDPFFTTKSNGTGLGLALTHKIVSSHSGSIEVSSQLGRGSRFTLSLAVAEGHHQSLGERDYAEADCHC